MDVLVFFLIAFRFAFNAFICAQHVVLLSHLILIDQRPDACPNYSSQFSSSLLPLLLLLPPATPRQFHWTTLTLNCVCACSLSSQFGSVLFCVLRVLLCVFILSISSRTLTLIKCCCCCCCTVPDKLCKYVNIARTDYRALRSFGVP